MTYTRPSLVVSGSITEPMTQEHAKGCRRENIVKERKQHEGEHLEKKQPMKQMHMNNALNLIGFLRSPENDQEGNGEIGSGKAPNEMKRKKTEALG